MPPELRGSGHASSCSIGSELFVADSNGQAGNVAALDALSDEWFHIPFAVPLNNKLIMACKERLFVYGIDEAWSGTARFQIFDPDSQTWIDHPEPPAPTSGYLTFDCTVTIDTRLFALGRERSHLPNLDLFWYIFDFDTGNWRTLLIDPSDINRVEFERDNRAKIFFNVDENLIHVTYANIPDHHVFDTATESWRHNWTGGSRGQFMVCDGETVFTLDLNDQREYELCKFARDPRDREKLIASGAPMRPGIRCPEYLYNYAGRAHGLFMLEMW